MCVCMAGWNESNVEGMDFARSLPKGLVQGYQPTGPSRDESSLGKRYVNVCVNVLLYA